MDAPVNELSHVVKSNGKSMGRLVKEFLDEGYVFAHEGGKTMSLNVINPMSYVL